LAKQLRKRRIRKVITGCTGFFIAFLRVSADLAQSLPPFASSAEYESMLMELARLAPRPSRIAAVGKLVTEPLPAVTVEESESFAGLCLETAA
jgi:hypothetical protein